MINFFVLIFGYVVFVFNEFWCIWIDFDQDGDYFDFNELFYIFGLLNMEVIGLMVLFVMVVEGIYIMWVFMKYGSLLLFCVNVVYGEVEEYIVEVVELLIYCSLEVMSFVMEWLASVQIGDIINNFGNNGGYGNFLAMQYVVIVGDEIDFMFIFGFNGFLILENWGVYVDFNIDGDFDDLGEEVYICNNYFF